jgi:hypothetical protein
MTENPSQGRGSSEARSIKASAKRRRFGRGRLDFDALLGGTRAFGAVLTPIEGSTI